MIYSEDTIKNDVHSIIEFYGEDNAISMCKALKRQIDECIDDMHDAELIISKYKYFIVTEYFKNKYEIPDGDSFELWLALQ